MLRAAQGARPVARPGGRPARPVAHRAGVHAPSDRVHAAHAAPTAPARRPPAHLAPRPQPHAGRAALDRRAGAHGTHHRLADGGQLARATQRGRRARARAVLPCRGDLRGHPGVLRGGRGGAVHGVRRGRGWPARARDALLRLLGRRRHGRASRRARQDDPRELRAPPPADRQPLLPRDPDARRAPQPEHQPRRGVAGDRGAHRAVPQPRSGGAHRHAGKSRPDALSRVPRAGGRAAARHV